MGHEMPNVLHISVEKAVLNFACLIELSRL
jgi:hypothetical protein